MPKNKLFYTFSIIVLSVVMFFFLSAYNNIYAYSELNYRHNKVNRAARNLGKQINNATIKTLALSRGSETPKAGNLYFTDSLHMVKQLELRSQQLQSEIITVRNWMFIFITLSGCLMVYTVTILFKQRAKKEKLEEQQALFASIVDSSDDAILSKDLNGNITSWNPGAVSIFGFTREEILGRHISVIIPAHLLNEETSIIEKIKNGMMVDHYETQRIRKDKSIIDVSLTISPLKDLHGNIIGASKIVQDITRRKRSEEQLIKSEKIYRTIASSIPGSVICLLDLDFRYLLTEGDMLENLGYKKDMLLGNKAEDVLPPAIFSELNEAFQSVLQGKIVSREIIRLGYDIISRYIPLKDKDNTVYAILTVSIDITMLKNAQRDIAELNRNLEAKIAVRTEQLNKSNEALEAFSYSVSHDLRAPLRGIIGFTSILEESYGNLMDEEGKRITSVIKKNTLKMGLLIDDLLRFSKIGKQEILKDHINVRSLVQDVIQSMNIKEGAIKWNIAVLPGIRADLNTMRQVWVNLLSNAVKYSANKEQPEISIGYYEEKKQIVFFVKDNGVGFDEQYSQKLFKVFQRLHSSRQFEGTGVGLAIVEKIVTRHEGLVWASGKVDEGATFYFSIPV